MLPRSTSFPVLHVGHSFWISPSAIALASFPAAPSMFFVGHVWFRQKSIGRFFALITVTIGKLQVSHNFFAGFINAFDGNENVVLQSGYLLHATNLPNFPRRI